MHAQTSHTRQTSTISSRRSSSELDRLMRDIHQQRTRPERAEVVAMALILLVFIGAVLVFALAATQML